MKKIINVVVVFLTISISLLSSKAMANPNHAAAFAAQSMIEQSNVQGPGANNPTSSHQIFATVDSAGNVGNTIVCAIWCGGPSSVFGKTVPIASTDSGSPWQGPGTTTYDIGSNSFTIEKPIEVVEQLNENNETVSTTIYKHLNFTYEDVENKNIFNPLRYIEKDFSIITVTKNGISDSLSLGTRKTALEVQELINNSNLLLLNSKVQVLISLLGGWVK